MANDPRRIHPPSKEEVERIAAAMADGLGPLVLCAAWSGTRLSETCKLEKRDVTDCGDFARLVIYKGKGRDGGKTAQAILLGPGWQAVKALPTWQFGRDYTALFVPPMKTSNADRWCRRSVWKRLDKARREVGLEHVIFHDFRKFYATHLLNEGVSDVDVAVALRHLDKNGQPDTNLVRRVYGFVNHDRALDRVAEVANVISTGAVADAEDGCVAAGEPHQVASGRLEADGEGAGVGRAAVDRGAGVGARDDEGLGSVAGGSAVRARQDEQGAASSFSVAVEDARRALRASATRAAVVSGVAR